MATTGSPVAGTEMGLYAEAFMAANKGITIGGSGGISIGSSPGTTAGTSTGANTGTTTGTDTGAITGTETGTAAETDTGATIGTETGATTGTETGATTGTDMGTDMTGGLSMTSGTDMTGLPDMGATMGGDISALPATDPTATAPAMAATPSLPPGFDPIAAGQAALAAGLVPLFPFFTPSFDLAFVSAVVMTIVTVVHVYLVFKTKALYFSVATQAAALLALALILKTVLIGLLNTGPNLFGLFSAFQLLFMIPGSIIPISLFFTYTRLMWWITPPNRRTFSSLWLPPMYHSITIGAAQTIADLLAMAGSGQFIKPLRPKLVSIGAVSEMLVFMYFTILVARFTLMSRRWRMEKEVREGSQKLGWALTASGVLLSIRGVMLVLEKDAQSGLLTTFKPSSIVTTDEWTLYVFDIAPQILILTIMAVYFPGSYLPKRLKGFRLKTRALIKEEKDRGVGVEGPPPASNGWIISSPRPVDLEKLSVSVSYMEAAEEERSKYEPKYVGYAQ